MVPGLSEDQQEVEVSRYIAGHHYNIKVNLAHQQEDLRNYVSL